MSTRIKRKYKMSTWRDKVDKDVLNATSETFRITVDRSIQQFLRDDQTKEFSFPADLNNLERKHVHQKAAAYSLCSRSHGKDPHRVITLYKKHTKSNFESFYVSLTPDTGATLARCLAMAPPPAQPPAGRRPPTLNGGDKVFGRLSLGPPPPVAAPRVSPQIRAFQRQLPIYELRDYVLERIRANQVLIVSSETGSGKTTQIPQYVMDDCRARGEPCRVLCTQPRRISTVSVAERVSQERGAELGVTVGYHIRLESKLGNNCNLVYCTNGVLIRSLMSGNWVLDSLTHIIIDEVHERDKLSDFLLICLRQCLQRRANVKLILMSATINIAKFADYFDGAEVLSIPGRLYQIEEVFLDEILEMTGYNSVVLKKQCFLQPSTSQGSEYALRALQQIKFDKNLFYDQSILCCYLNQNGEQSWAQLLQLLLSDNMNINYQHSESGFSPLMVAVLHNQLDMVEKLLNMGANPHLCTADGLNAVTIAQRQGFDDCLSMMQLIDQPKVSREEVLSGYYKLFADEDINFELLVKLITTIHINYQQGAILVFLPGYDDIMICNDRLMDEQGLEAVRIFFLHGSMNIREQNEVFKKLHGVRKIILSTNIAETSLTIDDVVYVIDTGKAKVQTYDSCSGISSLQTQWISKACVKQRAGRAGRVQNGMCFHLFSRTRYDSFLDERIPEMLRVPLEELCLNTKTLAGNSTLIYDFLAMAPDAPSSSTVKTAIENLECLGALDPAENLTPLGEYLSQLTIEPHLGKMLIYSVIFKCLDPILTIVASLAQKDPFQLPPQANLKTAAAEKRKSLTGDTYSDHIVYLRAFIQWQESVKHHRERFFCREFFISPSTMETILKTRGQLLGQLRAAKFVPSTGPAIIGLNQNSDNWAMVKAVIASGLYPKLAFQKSGHYSTRSEKKVLVHNSSSMGKEVLMSVWLVYDEMIKVRNGHQLRGVTPITPLTISLLGGINATSTQPNFLAVDEWLEFEFPTGHIIELRKLLQHIIDKKLQNPITSLSAHEEQVLGAFGRILANEDRHVGLPQPLGISQKPRFFEFNRGHEMAKPGPAPSSSQGSEYAPRAQSASHANAQYYNRNESGATRAVYNGNGRMPRAVNRALAGLAIGGGASSSSSEGDEARGGAARVAEFARLYHGGKEPVYLVLRVTQEVSVKISHETNRWIFSPQTEKQVMQYSIAKVPVYLIYSVPRQQILHGVAFFNCFEVNQPKPRAIITWLFKNAVLYKTISHLRNPANANRIIYDAVDGQVIETNTAKQLFDIFSLCSNNN